MENSAAEASSIYIYIYQSQLAGLSIALVGECENVHNIYDGVFPFFYLKFTVNSKGFFFLKKKLYNFTSDDISATRGATAAAPPNLLMLRTC